MASTTLIAQCAAVLIVAFSGQFSGTVELTLADADEDVYDNLNRGGSSRPAPAAAPRSPPSLGVPSSPPSLGVPSIKFPSEQ
ncbi:hypothetical protein EG68_02857 [Paragonimus skrjabini miyazakii]|uniref:Secreted protein n=1 Tax=Paragonimus skrjabini miyazakii TaxID=59628 RepID=A0A8S9YZ84_9TREM|nr:hypothetical protein EG68_02857 [Paragonimus skrjabini miyazakii]